MGHILYPNNEGIILGVLLLIKKKVWHFELLNKIESFIHGILLNAHH